MQNNALQELRDYLRKREFGLADLDHATLTQIAIERAGSVEQYLIDSKQLEQDINNLEFVDLTEQDEASDKFTIPPSFKTVD